MSDIRRRAFMKGAAMGAFAFTVGGVEVMLTAGEARAQGAPFRLLNAHQGETIEALGETLVPQRSQSQAWRILSIAGFRVPPGGALLRAPRRRRAPAVCERGLVRPSGRLTMPAARYSAASSRAACCRRAARIRQQHQRDWISKVPTCRPGSFVYTVSAPMPSTSVYRKRDGGLSRPSYSLSGADCCRGVVATWRTRRWERHRHCRRRRVRLCCFASVMAKAGRKNTYLLGHGKPQFVSDLVCSEVWGRRLRPAGAQFTCSKVRTPFQVTPGQAFARGRIRRCDAPRSFQRNGPKILYEDDFTR